MSKVLIRVIDYITPSKMLIFTDGNPQSYNICELMGLRKYRNHHYVAEQHLHTSFIEHCNMAGVEVIVNEIRKVNK